LGRLRVLSGKEICDILSQYEFKNVRQRGSHVIMQLKTKDSTITVPVPNHKEIKTGTLKSIIRQSGIPAIEFEVK
jgi:predicted RNA binding protein YcfA (HicA-like mRNA interferase family)